MLINYMHPNQDMALPKSTYISKAVGRPTEYTLDIANEIAERLQEGELLSHICQDAWMPNRATVYRWLDEREGFRDIFTRARRLQTHTFADQLLIRGMDESRDYYTDDKGKRHSDNTAVLRDGLLCRNMMFLMERINSETYALKNNLNVSGNITVSPAFNVNVSQPAIASEPSATTIEPKVIDAQCVEVVGDK